MIPQKPSYGSGLPGYSGSAYETRPATKEELETATLLREMVKELRALNQKAGHKPALKDDPRTDK